MQFKPQLITVNYDDALINHNFKNSLFNSRTNIISSIILVNKFSWKKPHMDLYYSVWVRPPSGRLDTQTIGGKSVGREGVDPSR